MEGPKMVRRLLSAALMLVDGGMVGVNLVGSKLAWTWSGAGGVTVIAVLERTGR
jgi:hypothetical protein